MDSKPIRIEDPSKIILQQPGPEHWRRAEGSTFGRRQKILPVPSACDSEVEQKSTMSLVFSRIRSEKECLYF